MPRIATNKKLHEAKSAKNDEFYTILADIERELRHYKPHFKNKTVLCNCDDPRVSNFFHYFSYNFEQLGLRKLITTCYKNQNVDLFSEHKSEIAVYLEYIGDKNTNNVPDPNEIGIKQFRGDGDFRSKECVELLIQADIVVTNPPFSLFREYVAQLIKYDKNFLIIGNWNATSYKEIFKLIKENKLWIGINSNRNFSGFIVPKHYSLHGTEARIDEDGNRIVSSNNTCWFTNLDIAKRHEDLILYKTYNKTDFPEYDNYAAINVDAIKDIPCNYSGVMGVPITFLNKYNPSQFEIIGQMVTTKVDEFNFGYPYVNGKKKYARILIQNKKAITK
ncbi:MAG: adenine-specific methyltransferase EcoRI family protein [Bacteroidales bacterium]|nr:adenine-specific methyltransferase EcoRI family protein [Bacteroidales bacterium]